MANGTTGGGGTVADEGVQFGPDGMRLGYEETEHGAGLGGVQRRYDFANGYGASVIRTPFSYGGDAGLWEIAVLGPDAKGRKTLCYSTPITDDVLGHLSVAEVNAVLAQIEALPAVA